jgi:hydrogenase-1 operon protein HyaE
MSVIERLTTDLAYPLLSQVEQLTAFAQPVENAVIFLPNNPQHYPETLDVAIVLPELVKVFQGQFKPAVADWDYAKTLAAEYAITEWPALLFLRYGEYVGSIARVRDWSVYLSKIKTLLAAAPIKKPGIGIAVVSASSSCS